MRGLRSSLIVGSVLAAAPMASGAIVYQQAGTGSGTLSINGNAFDYIGDSAFLAGTEREITQIDVATRYFGTRPATLTVTMELYADMSTVDGLPDDVDGVTAGNQYQTIGSSTIVLNYVTGPDQVISFPFANVLVPDNIIFAIKQDTFDNNFALFLGGGSTIGDSFNVSGSERIVFSQQGNDNFGRGNTGGAEVNATIHAVPEPATVGLLAAAAGLLASRRRRRRLC